MKAPGSAGRRRSPNLVSLALLTALTLLVGACSLFGPSEIEAFSLSRVNNQPLPTLWVDILLTNGVHWGQQWNRGIIRFTDDGRFSRELEGQILMDGVPADTTYTEKRSGRYERTETSIILRYMESTGPYEMTLHVLDSGHTLRSDILSAGVSLVQYEFIRREGNR